MPRHRVVEDGDLENVAPKYLESHEVVDLNLMSNGQIHAKIDRGRHHL
jgi:hypothetical protein